MKTTFEELEKLLETFNQDNSNLIGMLRKNPRLGLLIRLNTGMPLTKFGEMIGSKPETLSQNEIGKTKTMSKPLAEKLIKAFANSSGLNEQKIKETFLKFKELSNGGQKQAFSRAEKSKATKQESNLMDILTTLKIPFNKNKTIKTSIGLVNVDFEINVKDNPIFIETTVDLENKKMESMDLRAVKVKQTIKNSEMVAVIPDKSPANKINRLEDFDLVVKESEFKKFANGLLAP